MSLRFFKVFGNSPQINDRRERENKLCVGVFYPLIIISFDKRILDTCEYNKDRFIEFPKAF